MKSVSNDYKEQLTALGRQYKVLVTYTQNNQQVELSNSELNIVTPHYEGDLLKSVMKQLDLDSNVDIPIGTEINCQFGLLVGNNYEYIDYGNYIVYSNEKQEDLKSYKIVCYDKMLNAMKDYQQLQTGNNLLNLNNFVKGRLNQNTGQLEYANNVSYLAVNDNDITFTATVNWNNGITSEFIPIEQGKYYYRGTPHGDRMYVYVDYYDTNKNWISRVGGTNSADGVEKIWELNFNEPTAVYVRLHYEKATTGTMTISNSMLRKSDTVPVYEPYLQTTFPMSVKDYLTTLSYNLNIPLATQSFVNDDVEISSEKYLDENGGNLGYTYRDVLDELAQATASTICINEDDELEVRYTKNSLGKNVFDFSKMTYDRKSSNVTTFNILNDNTIYGENNGSTYSSIWFNIETPPSGTYVLSAIALDGDNIEGNVGIGVEKYPIGSTTRDNWHEIWFSSLDRTNQTRKSVQFNIDSNHYYKVRVFINQAIGSNKTTIANIMLEKNPTMSEYEPAGFTINETYLKDTNVNFKEKYGPINSVVFSRSGDSDLIYRKDDTSIEQNGLCELKIKDNQILNGNDRDNFIDEIYNQLNGLEYYVNDYTGTGITILELCDKYNVKVGENIYPCVMFNDELNVTQGFDEMIHTDKPETNESDYKKADTTDRRINQAYIIVDKQKQEIEALTDRTDNLETLEGNDKQELLAKFGNYALNSTVTSLTNQVRSIQTDSYTRTEVNQILKGTFYDEDNNQVVSEIVKTISGTFDENGMTYAKTNAKTSTTINEIGVRVNNTTSSAELLFAGYDDSISQTIVRTDNLLVRNFLNIGSNSRLQDYETGTGVFDI